MLATMLLMMIYPEKLNYSNYNGAVALQSPFYFALRALFIIERKAWLKK